MNVAEVQLVQLSRTGDRAAFRELVNMYKDKLHRLAYRMLHDRYDSEDVVQETFMRVYMNLNHYDENQKFSTWIYRIGKNLCIDLLRKKKVDHSLDAGLSDELEKPFYEKLPSADASPESRLIVRELQEQLRKVIDKLSDKYKQVVTLYYLHEMSLQEISELLGMPVTTVKSRLHRGREQLRKKWGLMFTVGIVMFFCGMVIS
jgi:RNA polymerase sigma-70 factor (ECF subfamily)